MPAKFNPLIFSGIDLTGSSVPPSGAVEWKSPVATEAALPLAGNSDGDARVALDTDKIYVWDATTSKWIDSKLTTAAFGATPNADGLTVSSVTVGDITRATINLEPADATNPGAVSTTAQTFAGDKTFNDDIIVEGSIDAKGGIDSSTNTLTIGATADFINIGGAGATITINGDTTYEHVTDLVVKDKTITLNDGGGLASGANSGIEVEENSVITGYAQVSSDRNAWELKAPNQVGVAVIDAGAAGITIDQSSHDPVTIAAIPNGLSLTGQELSIAEASAVDTGVVTTGIQTFAGDKTFNDNVAFVDVIDVQTGIDSTTGTLTLGGINTTTVNIGEPATGITSAIFYGVTDHSGYDITNFGQLSTSPTGNQAVITTVTSSSTNPDYSGLIFSEANPEQADILYTAGGTLNLNSSQNLALTAPNFNVDSANVDIGQLGGTTDLIGGTVTLDSADVNIGQSPGTTDIVGTVTIEYNPADPTDWAPAPNDVIEAIDQLADRFAGQEQDTKEPTGFVNRTSSTLTFSDSAPARTFTITPIGSFSFYVKGKKFTKTSAESIVISATAGDHYIYYNDSGVLQESTDPDFIKTIILEYAYVAVVYWNTDTNTHTYFGDERHGIVMDGATHGYLHTVFGARFLSGLALNFLTIPTTVDGTGNSASDAQFPSDQGKIRDEDILHEIPVQAQIPILYRQGSLWRKKTADAYPLIYQGTAGYGAGLRLPYNQFTGTWVLTEVQDSKFVLVHYFGTNDIDNPFIGIQGITEYNSIEDARINANTEISSLSGLPFTEFVPVGSVIFQTRDVYTNAPKARIRSTDTGANYVDFRGSQLYTPAGTATTHGLLSGLGNDDHFQYLLADGTRTMGGALNMGTHQINNVVDPISAQDAATKNYVDGKVADSITDGVTTIAPSQNAVFDALALKADDSVVVKSVNGVLPVANAVTIDTDDVSEGITNVYFTDSRAQTAVITQTITNGVTDKSPSEDAVFDALALKQDVGNYITDLTGEVTASGPGSVASTITANAVTNAKLAQMPASTLKGNNTGLTADPTDLSASDVRTLLSVLPSFAGDIQRTTFVALDNTITPTNVTGLAFANGTVRGFDTILSVERDTTYAEYSLKGIQKGASWEMSQDYIGDETGLTFSITSAGQIQYISTNTTFNAILKFRALSV